MLINNLANRYNVSIRTLRYYEELGLLSPNRNESNIRDYDSDQIRKLESIVVFKQLKISLSDIKLIFKNEGDETLRKILSLKLVEAEKHILELQYSKRLLQSVFKTFGSKDISKQNIEEFLNEQIYISNDDERWKIMLENTDHLVIEIGEKLIPIAVSENTASLVKSIKELRAQLKSLHNYDFEKIRLKDNIEELEPYEYQIRVNDRILCKSSIEFDSADRQIDHIITNLKAILI